MEKTLYETLIELRAKKPARFHMPGHKGRDVLGVSGTSIDFTELEELDNLHEPTGVIARSQELAASLFGARRTFFLVNGSSAGIIASMLALTKENSPVVCARNSHISTFKGLCLSGAIPVYVPPEIIDGYGVCGGIEPREIERALAENEGTSAVFIVSPTYEGITSNVAEIAEITHRHGAVLVVDEAHGSHFKFGSVFPKTALSQGADVVIQSWHKTLAALGQGAVLHINGNAVDEEKISFYLSVMQTTSPSYAIMASLDRNRELLQKKGHELFKRYEGNLLKLRRKLSQTNCVRLMSSHVTKGCAATSIDVGKIVLFADGAGLELDEHLRSKGIYAEMALPDYVVLMTSFMDKKGDYRLLAEAVAIFVSKRAKTIKTFSADIYRQIPKAVLSPRELLARSSEKAEIEKSVGKMCAGFITPYPPGIPIAAPGEIITEEIVKFCREYGGKIKITGLFDKKYIEILKTVI